jgi:WD40 repeat protein
LLHREKFKQSDASIQCNHDSHTVIGCESVNRFANCYCQTVVALTRVRVPATNNVVSTPSRDGTIIRWNARTGEPIGKPLVGDTAGQVTTVAFGAIDGTPVIASVSRDGTIIRAARGAFRPANAMV